MSKTVCLVALLAALIILPLSVPVAAQDAGEAPIVDGLNNPRGLHYSSDGMLYVAEAGTAGDNEGEGPFGPMQWGNTARVVSVSGEGGEPTVVIDNLVSTVAFENYVGANAVYSENGTTYVVTGNGPREVENTEGVLVLDASGQVTRFIDLGAFEESNNPDEDEIVSNPSSIAVGDDGTLYIVDASGNDLLRVAADSDQPELIHVWEDLPVPTSIDVGPSGDLYVGFLGPYPYDPGTGRIEHWSADGELIETFDGLTAIVGVMVDDDGTIYAVQFSRGLNEQGWIPDSGRVLTVTADGRTPIAEGLNFPYGMTKADDSILVSLNSAFSDPGSGSVIALDTSAMGAATEAPAATEESSG
jgi:sugar lactone lactonase YvrE